MDLPAEPNEKTDAAAQTGNLPNVVKALRVRSVSVLAAGAGLAVLAVVPLFVTFSTTQIKSIFDQFTGGCVLVLDKTSAPNGQVFVTGHIAGEMPKQITLMFKGRDADLNTIQFNDAYRLDHIRDPDDLTFHPFTEWTCPGALCEHIGEKLDRPNVGILLTDLHPEFTLRFSVRLLPYDARIKATPDHLKVYAEYDRGFSGKVCRVEPRRWFNFWVWATPLKKAALFMFVIVAGGLLLKWAGGHARERSSP